MIFRFGDCELDTARVELRRQGAVQPVEPQVFRLLAYLIDHRDRVVTRDELYAAIWNGRVVAEAALYSRIRSARLAIGDEGQAQARIRTVSRTGYQFVAEVETACESAAAPPEAPLASTPSAKPGRRRWTIGVALGAVALLAVAYPLWRQLSPGARPVTPAASPTIAVLPFLDMSPAKDQEHFADGLTEELTDHLSRIPGMRVVARTSAFAFKDRHEDLRSVAKKLGAQNLLEGSVRRDGDSLRITAQLIDAQGKHIWSQSYDRKRADIFAVQHEVSRAVAAVLSVTVDRNPLDRARGGTRNLEAYDAFLAARAALVDPTFASPDEINYSLSQLRRATQLDPDFALAWAWIAVTHYRAVYLPARGQSDWNAEATAAANRALALAPDEPVVQVAVSLSAMQAFDWARAEKYLALASNDHTWACLGCFALNVGRSRDAEACLARAKEIEPLMIVNTWGLTMAYEWQDRREDLEAELQEGRSVPGGDSIMPYRQLQVAMADGNAARIRAIIDTLPTWDAWNRTMGKLLHDREASLAEVRRRVGAGGASRPGIAWRMMPAQWAAYHGDPRLAYEILRPVLQDATLSRLVWGPLFSDMRRLGEFKDFVRETRLIDYWRSSGRWGDFCKPVGADDFECS